MRIERCSICDEPTDKAGRSDDSLYVDLVKDVTDVGLSGVEVGPLCEICYRLLRDDGAFVESEE